MIELLRGCYSKVYIAKPYTSRISNSEKYIVCKGFIKSKITSSIIKKLENMIETINKNAQYKIIDMFTDVVLSESVYNSYKQINSELLLKQYTGINSILFQHFSARIPTPAEVWNPKFQKILLNSLLQVLIRRNLKRDCAILIRAVVGRRSRRSSQRSRRKICQNDA